MSAKIIKAIAAILSADGADEEDDLDLAREILKKVEELQAESFKIAVVGQLNIEGREKPRIVVLGPFTAQGALLDQDAWDRAAERHTASRAAGGGLAWRQTGGSTGRYMLAPVFPSAAKAWKFFPDAPVLLEEIEEEFISIRGNDPQVLNGPACLCGLKGEECQRHPQKK